MTRVPGHAVVGYFRPSPERHSHSIFDKGNEPVIVHGQVAVGVNESTAHLSALLTGAGLGQAFSFMVALHMQTGLLRTVLDDWSRPRHPLHVVYPSNRHLSARLRAFIDWIAETFAAFDNRARSREA